MSLPLQIFTLSVIVLQTLIKLSRKTQAFLIKFRIFPQIYRDTILLSIEKIAEQIHYKDITSSLSTDKLHSVCEVQHVSTTI